LIREYICLAGKPYFPARCFISLVLLLAAHGVASAATAHKPHSIFFNYSIAGPH